MIALIAVVFSLLLIFLCGLSYLLAARVSRPGWNSPEEIRSRLVKADLLGDFDALPKEEYSVRSFDGYKLHTIFLPAASPSDRYVICSHGYTINYYGSVPYALLFHSLGFHCVIYDSRGHGCNPRTDCTMGVVESRDLIAQIEDCFRRRGPDIRIGLHGESMGSGLQIMALRCRPDIRFIINDCGYADLVNVLAGKLRSEMKLPGWLVYPASLSCRLRFGYSFTAVRPIDQLRENTVPICFIHGDRDSFISCENSVRMQAATKGLSELHLIPGAEHAESLLTNRDEYRRIIESFLQRIDMR